MLWCVTTYINNITFYFSVCGYSQVRLVALVAQQVHEIPKIKGRTHIQHRFCVPFLLNLRQGYIYIPRDIICGNSSLKKFTAWQIRLNYLWAKTNRPPSQTLPASLHKWILSWQSFYLSYFQFYCRVVLASFFMYFANVVTKWTQASQVEIKKAGSYNIDLSSTVKSASICPG